MIDIALLLIAITLLLCCLFDYLIKSKQRTLEQRKEEEKQREIIRLVKERQHELEHLEKEKQREEFEQTSKLLARNFLKKGGILKYLMRKQKQLIMKDDYGDWYVDSWVQELERFVESKMQDFRNEWFNDAPAKVVYKWNDDYGRRNLKFTHYLERVIHTIINEAEIEEPQEVMELDKITDPIEYEHAVCEVFTNCCWNAQVTKASGDQGVDVIAELNSVRVAVQCKLYSSPVGNGAVQEVFAAKSHYDCQLAMVVTNNSYTTSAKQLASTCGVELLHHDALIDWIETQA